MRWYLLALGIFLLLCSAAPRRYALFYGKRLQKEFEQRRESPRSYLLHQRINVFCLGGTVLVSSFFLEQIEANRGLLALTLLIFAGILASVLLCNKLHLSRWMAYRRKW